MADALATLGVGARTTRITFPIRAVGHSFAATARTARNVWMVIISTGFDSNSQG